MKHRKNHRRYQCSDKKKEIICLVFSNGKTHNFSLFKKNKSHTKVKLLADTGYLGITKFMKNSKISHKNSKKKNSHKYKKMKIENFHL